MARFSKPSERSAGFTCAILSANGRAEALRHVCEFYGTGGLFPSLPQLGELSDYELSDYELSDCELGDCGYPT